MFKRVRLEVRLADLITSGLISLDQPNSTGTREKEALYQVIDTLMLKYRAGWPRLAHLSAPYARDSGTTTTSSCGSKAKSIVQCTLLYGAEAWTLYRQQVKMLYAFVMRCLCSIMHGQSGKQGNT